MHAVRYETTSPATSPHLTFMNDVTVSWRHCTKTHSWYSELNSLQNVYFGFFILGKLIEWCCFVTYLWNDPRRLAMVWSQTMPMSYFLSELHSSWNTSNQLQCIIIIINSICIPESCNYVGPCRVVQLTYASSIWI